MFNKKEYMKNYWDTHRERKNETMRKWIKTIKGKEYTKRYAVCLKRKEYIKRYRKSPKGKELYKKWRKSFKGKISEKIRYLRRKMLNRGLSIKTIQLIYEDNIKNFGTLTCYLCLRPIEFGQDSLEHKIPLSRNGTNDYNNLAVACISCNSKKRNKTLEEYRGVGHELISGK